MGTLFTVIGTLIALGWMFVYFGGAWYAAPNFTLRYSGIDQNHSVIYGPKGYFIVGVSTLRPKEVTIRSFALEPLAADPIRFRGNDMFKVEPASGARVLVRWRGDEWVRQKNFLLFAVPYQVPAEQTKSFSATVSVSLSGGISPEEWGIPWSLCSLPTKTVTLVKHLTWKPTPDAGEETGFRMEPQDSARLSGEAARDSLIARGQGGWKLDVTEIFEDGSYQRKMIYDKTRIDRSSPSPSP